MKTGGLVPGPRVLVSPLDVRGCAHGWVMVGGWLLDGCICGAAGWGDE